MRHFAIVAAFIGLVLVLTHITSPVGPFLYDEADYMHAARLGFVANFLDRPAMPIADFVRTGLSRGRQPSERHALSESIRESNDIPFYRHWHGPVYYYWLMFASLFTADDDMIHRLSVVFPILTILLLYFGSMWLTPGREGQVQGALAAALFGFSVTAVASMELAPHHLFVLISMLSLILLAKAIVTGERRYFYGAVVAAGVDFGTLEMTLILLCTLLVSLVAERRALRTDWGFFGKAVLTFLGTVLVAWPGAIFKLSFLKSYLGMGYLIVFRRGQAQWGGITLGETWVRRLTGSPVEWALIAIALVGLVVAWGKVGKRYLYPFLVYAALMLLATGSVAADAPRYGLTFLPPLEFVAAAAIATWVGRRPLGMMVGVTAGLCAALFVSTYIRVSQRPKEDKRPEAVLAFVRENKMERSSLIVPNIWLPMLHYYYPEMHLRSYEGDAPAPTDFEGKRFDGFIYTTYPIRYQSLTAGRGWP